MPGSSTTPRATIQWRPSGRDFPAHPDHRQPDQRRLRGGQQPGHPRLRRPLRAAAQQRHRRRAGVAAVAGRLRRRPPARRGRRPDAGQSRRLVPVRARRPFPSLLDRDPLGHRRWPPADLPWLPEPAGGGQRVAQATDYVVRRLHAGPARGRGRRSAASTRATSCTRRNRTGAGGCGPAGWETWYTPDAVRDPFRRPEHQPGARGDAGGPLPQQSAVLPPASRHLVRGLPDRRSWLRSATSVMRSGPRCGLQPRASRWVSATSGRHRRIRRQEPVREKKDLCQTDKVARS